MKSLILSLVALFSLNFALATDTLLIPEELTEVNAQISKLEMEYQYANATLEQKALQEIKLSKSEQEIEKILLDFANATVQNSYETYFLILPLLEQIEAVPNAYEKFRTNEDVQFIDRLWTLNNNLLDNGCRFIPARPGIKYSMDKIYVKGDPYAVPKSRVTVVDRLFQENHENMTKGFGPGHENPIGAAIYSTLLLPVYYMAKGVEWMVTPYQSIKASPEFAHFRIK